MYHGERFNSISHLIGAILAVAGSAVLITLAAVDGDPWKIISVSVYGAVLVLLFTASTLYHSFQGRTKKIFQKIDHIAIFLLIAGSYTPFTLVTLRGHWGWWLFGAVWTMAVIGIIVEFTLYHKTEIPSLIIYVVMGWLAVVAYKPMLAHLAMPGIIWLTVGGLFYTIGILFYVLDRKLHFHGIWHLFVLAGSISHYFCVLLYVI